MIFGIVADDITGSNDIGIMLAKAGYQVEVYPFPGPFSAQADVVILNTNSRLDPAREAYEKVHAATLALQAAGCPQFFNKTCSVFRGNIGAEFDAMLDALGREFAAVVLGFPKNGRLTVSGIHTVHGQRLEDSEFRHDPIHPMTSSNLVEILAAQTPRKVALVSHLVVKEGSAALRAEVARLKDECNYLILDVDSQAALQVIAQAVKDEPVLCGSSALAEELPAAWGQPPGQPRRKALPARPDIGILLTAGSLMPQTAAQIEYLKNTGVAAFLLNTTVLFDPLRREHEIEQLIEQITSWLMAGEDALLHSPGTTELVAATREAGARAGYNQIEVARLVSDTLAEVTAAVLKLTGQKRLVVAGGETSAAVCACLEVSGLTIWDEIQPGLPSCLSTGPNPILLVLKSGSFGTPDFLQAALAYLRSK